MKTLKPFKWGLYGIKWEFQNSENHDYLGKYQFCKSIFAVVTEMVLKFFKVWQFFDIW